MDIRQGSLIPDPVKNGFLKAIDPIAGGLIGLGLRPNSVTTISVMLLVGSGAAYALQALRVGAILLLASGFFDLLDGMVARKGRMASKFGAFYDSTMDRLGEGALFTGIAIYFMTSPGQRLPFLGLGLCFAALSGSFLVSYARARAEGIGVECKVGMRGPPRRHTPNGRALGSQALTCPSQATSTSRPPRATRHRRRGRGGVYPSHGMRVGGCSPFFWPRREPHTLVGWGQKKGGPTRRGAHTRRDPCILCQPHVDSLFDKAIL